MATWLHCNSCFYQPGDGKQDIYMTSCGHLFCQNCQDKGWKIKCLWCGKPTPGSRKLNEVNDPSVDVYLSDPSDIIKQLITVVSKEFSKVLMTMDFQRQHSKRYLGHLQQVAGNQKQYLEKQKTEWQEKAQALYGKQLHAFQEQNRWMSKEMTKLKDEITKLKAENFKVKDENSKLRDENSYLKRLTAKMCPGGPFSPRHSPSGDRNHLPSPNTRLDRQGGSPKMSTLSLLRQNQTPRSSYSTPGQTFSSYSSVLSAVRPGRISVRTPPSGGRMGIIPGTPSPQMLQMKLPRSAPTVSSGDYTMETPPR